MTNDNCICRFVKQAGTILKKFFSSYGRVKSVLWNENSRWKYVLWLSVEHNVLLGSLWLSCLLGFLFAPLIAFADCYLHVIFLVLLFYIFSVSCHLMNKDEYKKYISQTTYVTHVIPHMCNANFSTNMEILRTFNIFKTVKYRNFIFAMHIEEKYLPSDDK